MVFLVCQGAVDSTKPLNQSIIRLLKLLTSLNHVVDADHPRKLQSLRPLILVDFKSVVQHSFKQNSWIFSDSVRPLFFKVTFVNTVDLCVVAVKSEQNHPLNTIVSHNCFFKIVLD